jgi:hypothetical protein
MIGSASEIWFALGGISLPSLCSALPSWIQSLDWLNKQLLSFVFFFFFSLFLFLFHFISLFLQHPSVLRGILSCFSFFPVHRYIQSSIDKRKKTPFSSRCLFPPVFLIKILSPSQRRWILHAVSLPSWESRSPSLSSLFPQYLSFITSFSL